MNKGKTKEKGRKRMSAEPGATWSTIGAWERPKATGKREGKGKGILT
jgi:hypothetical protein